MSKEDIEKAQKDAELHADEDKKKREAIDAKNHLEQAIYQYEKMPDEFKDKISDEDKDTIKKAVEEAKEVLKDTNAEASKYEEAAKELANKVMPIGAKLYQANSADQTNPEAGKTNPDEPVEGEVVDK